MSMLKASKYFIPLTGIVLFLLSCAPIADQTIENAYDSGELKIGMSQKEVAKIIKPSSLVYERCTKTKITEEAKWELWDFASPACGANMNNAYALIFKNGRLVEIREVQGLYADPPNYEDLHLP